MSATRIDKPAQAEVAILGGGISGLACAYFLGRAGLRPVLIEKSGRPGGLIKTDRIDGCELEAGPDSFLAAKPAVTELANQLGIGSELIPSNDAQRRIFIVRNGKLTELPPGMVMMIPGDLQAVFRSDFYSAGSKLRFLTEQFFRPRTREHDISIREFVSDHFGTESLEYVTEPLLSGVYGGDAGKLSAQSVLPRFLEYERQYGSLIRAARRERSGAAAKTGLFLSFRGGMQTLVDALTQSIQPFTRTVQTEATAVERTAGGWKIKTGDDTIEALQVVLACPAHVNARLLQFSAPELAAELAAIPYSSALLVTLVYERRELNHALNGFGFLVPRQERRGVAAATWISTKFPSRTPPELAALRAFVVGDEAATLMRESSDSLVDSARHEFQRLMNISAAPLFHTVYRWPDSMPQYVVGHQRRQDRIRQLVSQLPGLHLCGNAYEGVGLPDCVRIASEVANIIRVGPQ